MPPYRKYLSNKQANLNPVSYSLSNYGISFPSAAIITEQQVDFVTSIFKDILDIK